MTPLAKYCPPPGPPGSTPLWPINFQYQPGCSYRLQAARHSCATIQTFKEAESRPSALEFRVISKKAKSQCQLTDNLGLFSYAVSILTTVVRNNAVS